MKITGLDLKRSGIVIAFIFVAIVMAMVGAWIWHPVVTGYAQTHAFGALDADNTWTRPNRFNGDLGGNSSGKLCRMVSPERVVFRRNNGLDDPHDPGLW
jgi:hypothetical protein